MTVTTQFNHFNIVTGPIGLWVIFTDINFAVDNSEDIHSYLEQCIPSAYFKGLVIEFENEQDLSMFLLRWS